MQIILQKYVDCANLYNIGGTLLLVKTKLSKQIQLKFKKNTNIIFFCVFLRIESDWHESCFIY